VRSKLSKAFLRVSSNKVRQDRKENLWFLESQSPVCVGGYNNHYFKHAEIQSQTSKIKCQRSLWIYFEHNQLWILRIWFSIPLIVLKIWNGIAYNDNESCTKTKSYLNGILLSTLFLEHCGFCCCFSLLMRSRFDLFSSTSFKLEVINHFVLSSHHPTFTQTERKINKLLCIFSFNLLGRRPTLPVYTWATLTSAWNWISWGFINLGYCDLSLQPFMITFTALRARRVNL